MKHQKERKTRGGRRKDGEEGREAWREGKGAEASRGEGRKGRGREGNTEARKSNKDGKRRGRRKDRATERRNNGHTSGACVWLRFCGGRLVSRGLFVASAFSVSASNRAPLPSHHVSTDTYHRHELLVFLDPEFTILF